MLILAVQTVTEQINALGQQILVYGGALLLAFLIALGSVIKWYLPAVFKRRDKQAQDRLDQARKQWELDLETKKLERDNDMEDARSERETASKLLSGFLEAQSIGNETYRMLLEQQARTAGEMHGNTLAITDNTTKLNELSELVSGAITNIKQLTTITSQLKTENTQASLNSKAAAVAAERTLEVVQKGLNELAERSRQHDTKPIQPITINNSQAIPETKVEE